MRLPGRSSTVASPPRDSWMSGASVIRLSGHTHGSTAEREGWTQRASITYWCQTTFVDSVVAADILALLPFEGPCPCRRGAVTEPARRSAQAAAEPPRRPQTVRPGRPRLSGMATPITAASGCPGSEFLRTGRKKKEIRVAADQARGTTERARGVASNAVQSFL